MFNFYTIHWLPLAFLFFIAPSFAHKGDIETMVIEGKKINLIGDAITASQGIVGQAEIDARPLLRTGEILETIPGLVATQHSGSGKANQFFLRGFNLDHGTDFNTSIDGMPINIPSHGHGQGYTDLNFIIPETINSIQYQKGPYYANVGDFSSAGSASLTTLNAVENGLIKLTVGENNFYRAVAIDSFKSEIGNLLYGLEVNTYDGPWTDIEEDISKYNALIKYHKNFEQGRLEIGLMAYDNSWNSADQIPERAVSSGLIDELGSIDTTVGGESSRNSLHTKWETDVFSASAYFIQYDLNLWSNFTYFLNDPVNGDQFGQVDERIVYGGELNYAIEGHIGDYHTQNTLGVQVRVDEIDEVALYQTLARERIGVVRSDSIDETSLGVYWENKLEWNKYLRSIFGARYDRFDFEVNPLIATNTAGIDLSNNQGEADDSIVSLKASLIASLNEDWESYVSYGQGFHSNDARGTTIEIDPESGDAADAVDPLVRSEGYEIGVRGFIQDKLNTSLALWALTLDSELLFVGDAGNTEASRPSERYGLEATVYYTLNDAWKFDLEYAWSEAEFTEDAPEGNDIPGAIEQVVQAGVILNLDNGWSSQLRLRHFGERPLIEDDSARSEGSTIVNLQTTYAIENWAFELSILNLLDSNDHDIDYFYESQLENEDEAQEDVHFHVFEPRALRFEVTFNY